LLSVGLQRRRGARVASPVAVGSGVDAVSGARPSSPTFSAPVPDGSLASSSSPMPAVTSTSSEPSSHEPRTPKGIAQPG
jgi:hypothetical protein